jgi:hypothetical protein
MAVRKTVDVETVRTWANNAMSRGMAAPEMSDDFRNGVADLLERILHETGNYKGFRYNDWDGENEDFNRSYRYYY